MIIEIRKIAPNSAKALSMVSLLTGGWLFKEINAWWILSGCLAILSWFLSETYFGIRIEPNHQRLETGIGLLRFFKLRTIIDFPQISGISIKQRSDKYYGIGLALESGEFIELDKKATLDEATKRQKYIEDQVYKYRS